MSNLVLTSWHQGQRKCVTAADHSDIGATARKELEKWNRIKPSGLLVHVLFHMTCSIM